MNRRALCYALLIVGLLSGCSGPEAPERTAYSPELSSWPIYRGDRNLSGAAEATLPEALGLVWSTDTGHDIISSPVVGHGSVYVGNTGGMVVSLDVLTGAVQWEYDSGDSIEASPLLVEQTLYIGNLSGSFFALDARTGQVRWSRDIGGDIIGSANWCVPSGSDKVLILIGSYDNTVYSFDAKTGEPVWSYETDNYINGAPATDGDIVVIGGCDEQLHILSAIDGTKRGMVWAGSYIAGSAALVDNRAYVGHYGGKLVCIDTIGQEIVWEYEDRENGSEFFSSPAIGSDRIIIGSRDYYLHCVDRESGLMLWKFQTRDEVDSSPVIIGDTVLVGSNDGRLYMIDIESGQERWSFECGAPIPGSPAVVNGMVIVGARDGRVYAFGEQL